MLGKRGKARKRKNKQIHKSINQLNLKEIQAKLSPKTFNNFMDDENMCQAILKATLKNFDVNLKKLSIATEKTFEGKGKGVRFDLIVEDINNIINMEMQWLLIC